jgi:hypothetical protein
MNTLKAEILTHIHRESLNINPEISDADECKLVYGVDSKCTFYFQKTGGKVKYICIAVGGRVGTGYVEATNLLAVFKIWLENLRVSNGKTTAF